MKNKKWRTFSLALALLLGLTLSQGSVLAAESGSEEAQSAQQEETTAAGDAGAADQNAAGSASASALTTKAVPTTSYTVQAQRTGRIKYRLGGHITSIESGKTKSDTKKYTAAKTFTVKTYRGFTLSGLTVTNTKSGLSENILDTKVSSAAAASIPVKVTRSVATDNATDKKYKLRYVYKVTFPEGTNGSYKLSASYRRTGLFIRIDPGHAGYYNRGCKVNGKWYYESVFTWQQSKALKKQLDAYPNVVVSLTKKSLNADPGVYARGAMGKSYDILFSIHSNYSDSSSPRYTLSIVSRFDRLRSVAGQLGYNLAKTMRDQIGVPKTGSSFQVWTKKQSDGRDWFGINRGAADYEVPSMILEHSFHSNPTTCRVLMSSSRRTRMAKAEAAKIASYYNIKKSSATAGSPGKVSGFKVSGGSASWNQSVGASGYQVYRASSRKGTYKLVKTITNSSSVKYKGKSGYYYKVRAIRYTPQNTVKYSAFTAADH
ncbi:MAG: N-acetylmuramoyl-L-alanine amidase family protein [Anaerovoracaceae bacterium]|jgi:N-acetylmuramoyl-L-alanine amidase